MQSYIVSPHTQLKQTFSPADSALVSPISGIKVWGSHFENKQNIQVKEIRMQTPRIPTVYAAKIRGSPILSFPPSVLNSVCVGKWIKCSHTSKLLPDTSFVGRKDAFECGFLKLNFLSYYWMLLGRPHHPTSPWILHHRQNGLGMEPSAKKTQPRRRRSSLITQESRGRAQSRGSALDDLGFSGCFVYSAHPSRLNPSLLFSAHSMPPPPPFPVVQLSVIWPWCHAVACVFSIILLSLIKS